MLLIYIAHIQILYTSFLFTLLISQAYHLTFSAFCSLRNDLAPSNSIVSKVTVGISVVNVLVGRQLDAVLITIGAVVTGALGSGQVSSLVHSNVHLVNSAALLDERLVAVEPCITEVNSVVTRPGVGNDTTLAVTSAVRAVQARGAGARAVELGHLLKGTSNNTTSVLVILLEVLVHLAGRAGASDLGSSVGSVKSVLDASVDGSFLGASAITADGNTSLVSVHIAQNLGGLSSINMGVDPVGLEVNRAEVGNITVLGIAEVANRLNIKDTTVGEVIDFSNIECSLDRLTSGDLGEVLGLGSLGDVDTDTLEVSVGAIYFLKLVSAILL